MAIGPDRLTYREPPLQQPPLGPGVFVNIPPEPQPEFDQNTGGRLIMQPDGSGIVEYADGQGDTMPPEAQVHDANLAEFIGESELGKIGDLVCRGVDADIESRKDWNELYEQGVKLLGLKIEKGGLPFKGASTYVDPLLIEAIVRFQSNARGEMLPAEGPVKTQIIGDGNPQIEQQADRVATALNYYLTETATEYYPEYDRMLFYLPMCGSTFRKVYRCPLRKRPVVDFILPSHMIVSYAASDFENAPRVTNLIDNMRRSDMRRLQLSGFYRDVELGVPTMDPTEAQKVEDKVTGRSASILESHDEPYRLYETRVELDLEGFEHKDAQGQETGLPLPYLVTIEVETRKVLRIGRFWKQGDEEFRARRMYVKYDFIPGLGFYSLGLTHLSANTAFGATMAIRAMIDAGQFANFPAWLQVAGKMKPEQNNVLLKPGQGKEIETGGMPIGEAIAQLPFHDISAGLSNMVDKVIQRGERLAMISELPVGEGRQDAPVGTTLALLEQAQKPMSAIHKRGHVSMRQELRLLSELFAEDPEAIWPYRLPGKQGHATGADFADNIDVVPVSDPNVPSHVQRIVRAQALGQLEQQYPELMNRREVLTRQLQVLKEGDPEELMNPPPPQAQPMDPASENIAVMQGMPLKVGPGQDHKSHVPAHAVLLTSPAAAANPHMVPILTAHIVEHIAQDYREQVEAAIGQPLPPPGQPLPPQIEFGLSQHIAAVTDQLHQELAKIATGPFGADPAMVKMMETQVKMAQVQQNAQKTEVSARSAEIDNRVQAATAQQAIDKHNNDMQNAAMERRMKARDQNLKMFELGSKERVAQINAAAKETTAQAAADKAKAAAEKARADAKKARAGNGAKK